jgi:hypothetical protein
VWPSPTPTIENRTLDPGERSIPFVVVGADARGPARVSTFAIEATPVFSLSTTHAWSTSMPISRFPPSGTIWYSRAVSKPPNSARGSFDPLYSHLSSLFTASASPRVFRWGS